MKGSLKHYYVAALLIFSPTLQAYEQPTHVVMSEKAAKESVLSVQGGVLQDIGLKAVSDTSQTFRNSKGKDKIIIDLIQDGANFEDNSTRPVNHFFDPINNKALLVDGKERGQKSPDWALEDTRSIGDQDFSYRDARQYFHKALTESSKTGREKNFGLTFQTLGQVIHHLQDMAQPQHVRNDPHCDRWYCVLAGLHNPSRYEKYTDERRGRLPFLPAYASVHSGDDPTTFNIPRTLWHTGDGKGIADYTNRGFVSAGTNFDIIFYPSPVRDLSSAWDADIVDLFAAKGEPVPVGADGKPLSGKMTFFRNTVADHYRPTLTRVNDKASTYSIFDADLTKYNKTYTYYDFWGKAHTTNKLFTLNRFNFDAAHEFLIPRAVGYSAGLINYFFRGKLDFVPDKTDSTKYVIKNLGQELMDGTFTLYYDDAKDIRHIVPGASWSLVIDKNSESAPLSFTPPTDPAPKNEGEYMLVFNGGMGQEKADGGSLGAVVGKKIVAETGGFIITPSSLPADGITGRRLIYKNGSQWVLSKEAGLVAGNIDWKGLYVNGKPTKVLSWRGPNTRYFRDTISSYGFYIDPFIQVVYQNGKLFAVAPYPVLGAAITRDSDGKEWLIVICKQGRADVVYRKPNKESMSMALYNEITAPDGWQRIGYFPLSASHDEARTPWFFNGTGTEAQAMHLRYGFPEKPDRLKIVIHDGFASIANLGNLPEGINEYSGSGLCTKAAIGYSGFTSTSSASSATDNWVVAVDYLDQQEILAKVEEKQRSNFSGESNWGDVYQDASYTVSQSTEAILTFNGEFLNIYKKIENGSGSGSSVARKIYQYSEDNLALLIQYLDLRYNLSSYVQATQSVKTGSDLPVTTEINRWYTLKGKADEFEVSPVEKSVVTRPASKDYSSFWLVSDGNSPLCDYPGTPSQYSGSYSYTSYSAWELATGRMVSNHPQGIAIDGDGNLAFSIAKPNFRDLASIDIYGWNSIKTPYNEYLNYLTDGDLYTVTGVHGTNARFYPIGVK